MGVVTVEKKQYVILGAIALAFVSLILIFTLGSGSSNRSIKKQLSGNDNIEKAWNFYIEEGFSPEATAGILGNYMRESRINPEVEEVGNSIGYGLAQWSFTRRTDLERWAKENNLKVSSMEAQLNFSMYEMEKMTFGRYSLEDFKKIKDVKLATEVFEQHFERAGVVAMNERIYFAENIYNNFNKK